MNITVSEIFKKYGEPYFRHLENEIVKRAESFIPSVLSLGGGMLENHRNIPLLKNTGKIIYLETDILTVKERLKYDNTRPLLKSTENLELLYNSRCKVYTSAADLIVCAHKSPYTICKGIINNL